MPDKTALTNLHSAIQEVIDAIASKEFRTASLKLEKVNNTIETYLDTTSDDEILVELSKYQVLAQHLQNKLNESE
jgi:ABC-type phosphate transport system auxiliary subunit